MPSKLLANDEPAPVTVYNKGGQSPLLLVADHAGKLIPRALGDLGVPETERARHIGWDIGIAGVSKHLADALDAVLIQQNYSRLVIDCNRPPHVPSSMPELSEVTPIPGNVGLSNEARAAAHQRDFQALSRHDPGRARSPSRERTACGLDRDAFFHAGVQRRNAALAYRAPVQSRGAAVAQSAGLAAAGARSRGRRPGALPCQRPQRLHRAGAWRTAKITSHGNRNPPGSDRRRSRAAKMG